MNPKAPAREAQGDDTTQVVAIDDHEFVVIRRGQRVRVYVAHSQQGTWVWHQGRARLLQTQKPREPIRKQSPRAAMVTPPTPATVVRVLVQRGQRVSEHEALVVVSAMKMETTLVAPYAGTVRHINTQSGATVRPGDELVSIEADAGQA